MVSYSFSDWYSCRSRANSIRVLTFSFVTYINIQHVSELSQTRQFFFHFNTLKLLKWRKKRPARHSFEAHLLSVGELHWYFLHVNIFLPAVIKVKELQPNNIRKDDKNTQYDSIKEQKRPNDCFFHYALNTNQHSSWDTMSLWIFSQVYHGK